jgi:hypothetical protein
VNYHGAAGISPFSHRTELPSVRITALSLPLSARAHIATLAEPVLAPAAAAGLSIPGYQMPLAGTQRSDWLRDRLGALSHLDAQATIGLQNLKQATLVMVASRLPPVDASASRPAFPVRVWIATPDRQPLDAATEQALKERLTAFLHRMGLSATPVLIDCEVDVGTPGSPMDAHDAGLLRLDRMRPIEPPPGLGILGQLIEADDGRRWAVQPYVSEDNSRLQAFVAQLNRASGANALDVRLAAAPGGLIHAAMEIPDGLQVLPQPFADPAVRASFGDGIATDAWLKNFELYADPQRRIGKLAGHAVRMSTRAAMRTFGTPDWLGRVHGESVVRDLHSRLRQEWDSPLQLLLDEEITLDQVAGGIRRILRMSDDSIRELAGQYGLLHERGCREQVAHLIARRDVLATLSFLDRTDLDFYEDGTSPQDVRGIVVSRMMHDEIRRGRPVLKPTLQPIAPSRPRNTSVPHVPDDAVIHAALRLLRDPDFLSAPMSRGGVRWVYPIPGHPFVVKFSRRGAESVVRWREQFGGGAFPDSALAEGERHARRLNERYGRMVEHLGEDVVYAEHAMIVPDVAVPSQLLTGLAGESYTLGQTTTLPILATIQSVFPHIDAPGTLQCRFPYSEWNPALPDFGASAIPEYGYWIALKEWVLNLRGPMSDRSPLSCLMQVHPRSTADVFLHQCYQEPALYQLAKRLWTDLIGGYCASTGESADTSGPENALWYLDEHGERRLALLDFLYPDDCPILLEADPIMRRFLRGEPLLMHEKTNLLNAVNFARGANFMASALSIEERVDLFPDPLLKAEIAERADALFALFNTLPVVKLQPHPDKPWGVY